MPNQMHHVFHALADPTRMAVIQMLSERSASVSELAAPHKMALPSFTQHLKVLEDSKLVKSKKQGRVRTYELRVDTLNKTLGWLEQRRAMWEGRLDRLDNYLQTMKQETSND